MIDNLIIGKKRLEEYGIKPSLHRIAIIEHLINNPIHPTADMIFNELYPSIPTLSKTTVYNTLNLMEAQGAVQSILIDGKSVRYDADISMHGHFKCKCCGKILDIMMTEEELNLAQSKKIAGLVIDECQTYYKGYCKECSETRN